MRTDFIEAIKLSPKNETNYILRGKAKINLNDLNGAVKDFTAAIDLNHKSYDAWFNRGIVKNSMNDKTGGCADLNKALQLGSKDAGDAIKQYCK